MSPPETIQRPKSTRWVVWCQSRLSVQLRCSPVAPTLSSRRMKNRPCTWLTRSSPRWTRSTTGNRSSRNRMGCTTPRVSPRSLASGDDLLGAFEVHRDGNLDQGVLAVLERGHRHFCVCLAGAGDDHDVDLGVLQRFAEVGGPLLVAVLRRRTARSTAACDADRRGVPPPAGLVADRRRCAAGSLDAAQRLGVPDAHHSVADHADVQHRGSSCSVCRISRGTG